MPNYPQRLNVKLGSPNNISTDMLIIGGGGAGPRAAIEAKKHGADVLIVSEMICRAGLYRSESRGARYRQDYPEPDDNSWLSPCALTFHP